MHGRGDGGSSPFYQKWKWGYNGGNQDCPVALGDIDGDSELEVVGSDISKGKIYVLDFPIVDTASGSNGTEENAKFQMLNAELEIFPNPFTTVTSVKWSGISEKQELSLQIYDLSGRLVKTLATNHLPLTTAVEWDGTDACGKKETPGIYFVKFEAGNYKITQKAILLR